MKIAKHGAMARERLLKDREWKFWPFLGLASSPEDRKRLVRTPDKLWILAALPVNSMPAWVDKYRINVRQPLADYPFDKYLQRLTLPLEDVVENKTGKNLEK